MDPSDYGDIIRGDFTSYEDFVPRNVNKDLPDSLLLFLKLIFALVVRAGYILIQVGSIPVQNVYDILFHNVIEIAVASISFSLAGMAVLTVLEKMAENTTWGEVFEDHVAVGLIAVIIGTAQISAFLAGRIHTVGSILVTILYSALWQPLLIYSVWSKNGWLGKQNVIDHGGALTIHMPSTIFGLTGALFLGRRILRVRDLDEFSFSNETAVGTIIGYLMVIVGYITCSLPLSNDDTESTADENGNPDLGLALINNLLALAIGILMSTLFYVIAYRDATKYWRILRLLQGGIAGMMIIAPGVGEYTKTWQMYLLPLIASVFFFYSALLLHNTALEDSCNMTSSHLLCGFLGILLCPLFTRKINVYRFLLPILIVICSAVFAVIIFYILKVSGILGNKYEIVNHKLGTNVENNLPKRPYLNRLLMINDMKTPHIIPGSYRKRFIPGCKCKEGRTFIGNIRQSESFPKKEYKMNVEKTMEGPDLRYSTPAVTSLQCSTFENFM